MFHFVWGVNRFGFAFSSANLDTSREKESVISKVSLKWMCGAIRGGRQSRLGWVIACVGM